MNKYRTREIIWRLLIVGALTFFTIEMFFIPTNTYSKDPDWVLAYAASMIVGFIILCKLDDYYNKIFAAIILDKWLEDGRISNLLQKSILSNFIVEIEGVLKLDQYSPRLKLLQEYLNNSRVESECMKLAIEKYYTEVNKLRDEAAYQELKNRIENKL